MSFKLISLQDAESLMENKSTVIADIRNSESFTKGHIPNAINLLGENLSAFCAETNKSAPIVVYCHHGISSQAVAEHLSLQGFTNVYSLQGGYEAWRARSADPNSTR
ncbi:MAG TPA: rhodanese-like domain-containing protein [Coxiellaceae bacterium]|nr:rhodanese-like domain-containing protein [Coxiellaceae bacterium]